MHPDDDLLRWGEPPADPAEVARAEAFARTRGEGRSRARTRDLSGLDDLLDSSDLIDDMISTFSYSAGLHEPAAAPADPGGSVELRLRVLQLTRTGPVPVASTAARPTAVRDLRRVPPEAERVVLRTGERIRIEVVGNRAGHVTVLNVGPTGTVNLLWPTAADDPEAIRPGEALRVMDVELSPPTGVERLYAVWTPRRASLGDIVAKIRGGGVRDLKRVQESLDAGGEWHAVVLEMDHRG